VMIVDCLTTLITNWLTERGQLEEPTESMVELEKAILGQVEDLFVQPKEPGPRSSWCPMKWAWESCRPSRRGVCFGTWLAWPTS
jgi:hypothetical protein